MVQVCGACWKSSVDEATECRACGRSFTAPEPVAAAPRRRKGPPLVCPKCRTKLNPGAVACHACAWEYQSPAFTATLILLALPLAICAFLAAVALVAGFTSGH